MAVPTWSEADSGVLEARLQATNKQLLEARHGINQLQKFIADTSNNSGDDAGAWWNQLCGKLTALVPGMVQVSQEVIGNKVQEWEGLRMRGTYSVEELSQPLTQLRQWVERVTKQVLDAHDQLGMLCLPFAQRLQPWKNQERRLRSHRETLESTIVGIVCRTTLFLEQPPQVLRTTVRFDASIVCLAGNALDLDSANTAVHLDIVNEKKAKELYKRIDNNDVIAADLRHLRNGSCGTLACNTKEMVYDQTKDCFVAKFKTNLKTVKRSGAQKSSKSDATVTEEKFCLAFHASIPIGAHTVSVCKLSSPLVVIVHGNQTMNGRATMLWDRAFADHRRVPFHVPDVIAWHHLAPVLGAFFAQLSGGHQLTEDDLNYIGAKLSHDSANGHAPEMVTWQQLTKDTLPGRSFTFWEWFYTAAELVQKHLIDAWNQGAIIRFIQKSDGQRTLLNEPNGSFLIRFSDSVTGGVTLSWVGTDRNRNRRVWHLEPWYSKDFVVRPLGDRVCDLVQLQLLYPNIPKQRVFKRTRRHASGLSPDYVVSSLRTVVPPQDGRNSWCATATERKSADLADILGEADGTMEDIGAPEVNCHVNLTQCPTFPQLETDSMDLDDVDTLLRAWGSDDTGVRVVPDMLRDVGVDPIYATPVPVSDDDDDDSIAPEHVGPSTYVDASRTPFGIGMASPRTVQLCEALFPGIAALTADQTVC
eukprot:m.889378 g.889378  ORF g.889378 m.889378 type:complete len:701 (+) comp23644_c0_seq3:268-2370(+)